MNTIIENPTEAEWKELIKRPAINALHLTETVAEIINTVQQHGDIAVKNYSLKFHGFAPDDLWVTEEEIKKSPQRVSKNLQKAILLAKKNIEKFHRQQLLKTKKIETSAGVFLLEKKRCN